MQETQTTQKSVAQNEKSAMKIWYSFVIFLLMESYILTCLHICYIQTKVLLTSQNISGAMHEEILSIMTEQYDAWKGMGFLVLFIFICTVIYKFIELLTKKRRGTLSYNWQSTRGTNSR